MEERSGHHDLLLLSPGVQVTGTGKMRTNHPQVVQHQAGEPLGPGHLPLDHPVGDYDVARHRVEHIDQLQPELVIQEVTAGSEVVHHLDTTLVP